MCRKCAEKWIKTHIRRENVDKNMQKTMKNAYIGGIMVKKGHKKVEKTVKNAYIGGIYGQLCTLLDKKKVEKRIYGGNNWTEKCRKRPKSEHKTHI